MKRSAIGYSALLLAVICYAFAFYKMEIVTRTHQPWAEARIDIQTDIKYFCALIAGPGLIIFFVSRKRPIVALIYMAVALAWTVLVGIELRSDVEYWRRLEGPLGGAWITGILITWLPFFPMALVGAGLALGHILVKLVDWFDKYRPKPDA